MSRSPIRIRTFLVGTVLALLVIPTLAGGVAWLIEGHRQESEVHLRLDRAAAYLKDHRADLQNQATLRGFARTLQRLDLLAQLVVVSDAPQGKRSLYLSPALQTEPALQKERAAKVQRAGGAAVPAGPIIPASTHDDRRVIEIGTHKDPATLVADFYYRSASRTDRALVALVTAVLILLTGLAAAVWLAGRWMVAPLTKLSAQVDKVAGGDLNIAVPRSRVAEVANIAQAVEGMTAALGRSEEQRAEADEARRFLVTSVAHDLRTPLFALRGHLQAIGSRLGDPAVHLDRAEARAEALERLIGNLFAYTRDDFTQPAPQLEAARVAAVLEDVAAGLELTARLRQVTIDLEGDDTLAAVVDRDRLKRALTNILDNALRFSPAGGSVGLTWRSVDESEVEILVRDCGPGVDPNLLPDIFEPGIRGSEADDGGAGLGLTIAKRLLEHQHGSLTAVNHRDGGFLLRLTVPQTVAAPDAIRR